MSAKRAALAGVVKDLRAHIGHLRDEGVQALETSARPRAKVPAASKPLPPRATAAAPGQSAITPTAPIVPITPSSSPPPATTAAMQQLAKEVAACRICVLHAKRTHTVPGQGSPRPQVMFVGEAPGADEDAQGLAFVGRSGQLLTQMIIAMGFTREQVFIANICKCRPPDNRQPLPEEMTACLPFLRRQIALLHPALIVALGATAVKGLLNSTQGITKLRGTWCDFEGIPVMPTYHPAYLLRNPPAKHEAWADLQAVLKRLGRAAPAWTQTRKGA